LSVGLIIEGELKKKLETVKLFRGDGDKVYEELKEIVQRKIEEMYKGAIEAATASEKQ